MAVPLSFAVVVIDLLPVRYVKIYRWDMGSNCCCPGHSQWGKHFMCIQIHFDIQQPLNNVEFRSLFLVNSLWRIKSKCDIMQYFATLWHCYLTLSSSWLAGRSVGRSVGPKPSQIGTAKRHLLELFWPI